MSKTQPPAEDSDSQDSQASEPEASVEKLLRSLEQEMAEAGTLPKEEPGGEPGEEPEGEQGIPHGSISLEGVLPEQDIREVFSQLGNIFQKLAQSESGPFGQGGVNWEMVKELAVKTATKGKPEPTVEPTRRIRLEEMFKIAELHVANATELSPSNKSLDVATRSEWVSQVIKDWKPFLQLLSSSDKQTPPDASSAESASAGSSSADSSSTDPPSTGSASAGSSTTGPPSMDEMNSMEFVQQMMVGLSSTARMVKVGAMVGELSHSAFGYYALPIPPPPASKRNISILPDSVEEFAKEWSLELEHADLWICCAELLSHEILSKKPVQSTLWSLCEAYTEEFVFAANQEMDTKLESALGGDPGEILASLFGEEEQFTISFTETPEQLDVAIQASAIASVVAGYVHQMTQKIMSNLVGDSASLAEAFRRRNIETSDSSTLGRHIFGLRLDLDQGLEFLTEVGDATKLLWQTEESLPTPKELNSPKLWLARMEASTADS